VISSENIEVDLETKDKEEVKSYSDMDCVNNNEDLNNLGK